MHHVGPYLQSFIKLMVLQVQLNTEYIWSLKHLRSASLMRCAVIVVVTAGTSRVSIDQRYRNVQTPFLVGRAADR